LTATEDYLPGAMSGAADGCGPSLKLSAVAGDSGAIEKCPAIAGHFVFTGKKRA